MNLLKIFIPKDNSQEITELESWKVSWKVSRSLEWTRVETFYKCFIKEADAIEFRKQLEECAKFIKSPIESKLYKN
jgi:hypothetical protein